MMRRAAWILTVALVVAVSVPPSAPRAQAGPPLAVEPELPRPPASLKTIQPRMPDLTGIVTNKNIAIALGKAFFWDMQAGSDGVACASCHFTGGADGRIVNQWAPGSTDRRFDPAGDTAFGGLTAAPGTAASGLSPPSTYAETAGGTQARPNLTAAPSDFPTHRLADESDRNSSILYTTNDVLSSNGSFGGTLVDIVTGQPIDDCAAGTGDVFHNQAGASTRVVEPRHTPSVINSIFNVRNFWDGRANNSFNGVDPFGKRSPNAYLLQTVGRSGYASVRLDLRNASLASQAVGPPLSSSESSCANRHFAQIGRKLASLRPLALQSVAADDSRLGAYRHTSGKGLTQTYSQMIRAAFDSRWWSLAGKFVRSSTNGTFVSNANGFTQQEHNFTMFWGVAIMLYEAELISNETRADKHFDNTEPFVAGSAEMRGLELFHGKAQCAACHDGPLFSKATKWVENGVTNPALPATVVERMPGAFDRSAPVIYDDGFYNIGVTPTVADVGLGGTDPWGNPLSFTRQFLNQVPFARTMAAQSFKDSFQVNPCNFESMIFDGPPEACDPSFELDLLDPNAERQAIDGTFKTPTLRNIGLSAPYFHNGGYATLESVVRFYNRGGNRRGKDDTISQIPPGGGNLPDPGMPVEEIGEGVLDFNDSSGTGLLGRSDPKTSQGTGSNLAADVTVLDLTDQEIYDLVMYMLSFTDNRVACSKAPFDHPALSIPDGHPETGTPGTNAADYYFVLPAVGKNGVAAASCLQNTGDMFQR